MPRLGAVLLELPGVAGAARLQQAHQQGGQVLGVHSPGGIGPGGEVHFLFHDRLMKVAKRKTVDGVGNQATLVQPSGEGLHGVVAAD